MIGNGNQIGVQLPRVATLFIVMVPWPDFSSESAPGAPPKLSGLRLLASEGDTTRAWPGGFGYAKVGANYGTTFTAHGKALQRGFDQILWLFGSEGQITEAGASNFFVVVKNASTGQKELLTAPLSDHLILDGVTRRSILDLVQTRMAKELLVVEAKFTIHDLEKAWTEGRILEAFVSGTAVSILTLSALKNPILIVFCSSSSRRSRLSTTEVGTWPCQTATMQQRGATARD